jgi:hypothetical protein
VADGGEDEADAHTPGLLVDLTVQRASGRGPLAGIARTAGKAGLGISGVYSRTSRNSSTIASF